MIEELCNFAAYQWKFSFSSPEVRKQFEDTDRKICIAAHTTPFFDGMILHKALQSLNVSDHTFYVKGLFGLGPQWCKEIPNTKGFIVKEVEELRKHVKFCRVIFSSGGQVVWRSGYYVLAKETGASIIILGLDYHRREVVVDSILNPDIDVKDVNTMALQRLRKYGPGPLYFVLRVLLGYGCMTYDVSPLALFSTRSLMILGLLAAARYILPPFYVV